MRIEKNFLMVSNYNADISWILDYTDNYIIYDRSDTDEWIKPFDQSKVIKVPNIGWDIYDKFTYIIDHYDNLPETLILTKGNIFKYITKEEFNEVCNNKSFTPLFTKHHKTKLPVAFYSSDSMYNEINNSWYLKVFNTKFFKTYNDFIWRYLKKIPKYVKFGPGSNYLVTKKDILLYPKSFYEQLRMYIGYSAHPGEAQIMERILYYLWIGELDLDLKPYYKIKNYFVKTLDNIFFEFKKFVASLKNSKNNNNKKINHSPSVNITELRKEVKIYDIFTYNGEEDLLEIRLNILNNVVDQFIIVEAPTTFSGNKKPLYFEIHKERFSSFLHKIKYFVIDDYPNDSEILTLADSSPNVPKNGPEHWRREFYQKESIKKALTHLNNEDLCFVGDLDEIWNPDMQIPNDDGVYKLKQIVYTYFLNNKSNEPWAGTLVTKYKNIKDACLNHLRTNKKWIELENGGWHFTSMGGIEEVRRKLNDSYTDESYNTKGVQNNLEKRFGNKDYLGRSQFKFSTDERDLPRFIIDNKEKYIKLLKPTAENMGKKNIDVVIPVYNGAQFILDALNSVARQTLPPNKIIVVNDGSTDNTNELVSQFSKNSEVEVQIIKKENGGLSSARNAGIEASKAIFVAFLDADDIWTENKLEEQMRIYANSNFNNLGLVYCDYDVIDISGNVKFKNYKSPLDKKRMRGMVFDRLLERNKITSSGSGVLIKREVFNDVGLFDESLKFGEDWDMWLRIAEKYEVDFSEKILVHIRKHENNMTARQTNVFGNELSLYNKWINRIKGKNSIPLFWADKITFRILTHLFNKNFTDKLKSSLSKENLRVLFRFSFGSVYLYIPIFLVRQIINLIFSPHYIKIAINFIKHKGV